MLWEPRGGGGGGLAGSCSEGLREERQEGALKSFVSGPERAAVFPPLTWDQLLSHSLFLLCMRWV